MARPEKKIDWKVVQQMMEAQCLGTEIAAFFGMHPDTFYKRVEKEHKIGFSEYSTQKKEIGKAKMRLQQYKLGLEGNQGAQVWWGKNYLGQRDKPIDSKEVNPQIERLLTLLNESALHPKKEAA